jgi:choline-sulfatase
MAPAFLPFHGHPLVRAPHLRTLAEQGVIFDNAYCNSPLCSPSRAVFMTGQLPSRTGVFDNAAAFGADIPTWAHYLRQLGYRTVLAGKMHFCGPDQLHGFEARLTTDIYPADYGWTPDWNRPHERPSWYHSMSSVIEAGTCVRTNQLDFDDEVTFVAERAIYDAARGIDRRPFCMIVSLTHPHDPFAITQEYWSLYDHEQVPPPRLARPPTGYDPHSLRLRHVCAMDAVAVTDAQVRRARHAYFGAISYVDDNIGRLLNALRATALESQTVVLFASDHGEMLGERGLWYKMSFFEGAARVPLIVSAPWRLSPHRVAQAVSLVDLLPTLIALTGTDPESVLAAPVDGRSLLPHLEGTAGRDEVIGEYLAEGAIAPIVMIRRGRWKFIHSPADPDQLYDLGSDPDELSNLAEAPMQARLVDDFRAEVARRWDLVALDRAVRESQRRRRLVGAALAIGERQAWDFQPIRDASREYVRNMVPLEELEARARLPRPPS